MTNAAKSFDILAPNFVLH